MSNLSEEERKKVNFDHPDSIDFDLLTSHLEALKKGQSVEIPTYDFSTHTRTKTTIHIDAKPVIIVEGILVLSPEKLAALFDFKMFVKTDLDLCLMRRIQRDVKERGRTMEGVIEQYKETVRPMFEIFVQPTAKKADLIVKNNLNGLDIDMTPIIDFLQDSKQKIGSVKMKCSLTKVNGTLLYHNSNLPLQNSSIDSKTTHQLIKTTSSN